MWEGMVRCGYVWGRCGEVSVNVSGFWKVWRDVVHWDLYVCVLGALGVVQC